MTYFCPRCKRKHRPSSKIYEKHLKWKKVEKNGVPSDKVLPCNFSSLPQIAQVQIDNYLRKIFLDRKENYGQWEKVYIREINRVILHETQDSFLLK